MRRLILMRHAKSDWSQMGTSDHDRPLNKRGRKSATALGQWLRAKGYHPDQVLSSSSERTGETLLGLKLGPEPDITFTRALYLTEATGMFEVLRGATGNTVLMLGHNPGIGDMAQGVVNTPPRHHRFTDYPTGATLVCDFEVENWTEVAWHRGQVVDFVVPRELVA